MTTRRPQLMSMKDENRSTPKISSGGAGVEPEARRIVVPVLYVRGTHYRVGYDVGRNQAAVIRSFVARYANLREFEERYETEQGRANYELTLRNMKQRFPHYVKEVQGVADGADVPFHQLFLLQMDDLALADREPNADNYTGGCSSIAFTNGNETILGHTEDAFAETLNHWYIVSAHVTPEPEDAARGALEEEFQSLCYAGQLPGYTMGHNRHGLVYSINTLSPARLRVGSTPRTFLTRRLLGARSRDEAEEFLRDEGLGAGNGFSVNMVWVEPTGEVTLYNAEVAPEERAARSRVHVRHYLAGGEPLVHCNLYQRLEVEQAPGDIVDSSEDRLRAIAAHEPASSRAQVARILSDKTGARHQVFSARPEARVLTIAAGIFDVSQRTWNLYVEPPATSDPVAVLPMRFH